MDNYQQFRMCPACGGLHRGAHACSPRALSSTKFHEDVDTARSNKTVPLRPLTEDDVRRIVREELLRLQNGER